MHPLFAEQQHSHIWSLTLGYNISQENTLKCCDDTGLYAIQLNLKSIGRDSIQKLKPRKRWKNINDQPYMKLVYTIL